jgi:hypothetical protein
MTAPAARSPQSYARIGGLLYLAIIGLGLFGEMFVREAIIVPGDAAATMGRIAASQGLWRAGIAGDLLMHVLDVPLIVILYLLLRPVSRSLSLTAALLNVVQTAVLAANKLNLLVPVFLIEGGGYLAAFSPEQLQALGRLAIKAHAYGFGIGLLFFGFTCVVQGVLTWRSGYLPKALGALFLVAGLGYVLNGFAMVLAPAFSVAIFPYTMAPILAGELAMCLWLLFKGVDMKAWEARNA